MIRSRLGEQLIVDTGVFFVSFVAIRAFLGGLIRYLLNNRAYKKRKKGETFKEWLFYSRYKEEIPRMLRRFYFVILFIHPASMIASIVLYFIPLPPAVDPGYLLSSTIFLFDAVWITVIALLFWTPTRERGLPYERWISKKYGKKRK